jgi:polyhydroxyalkanoate synthesis regulator phasin
MVSRNPPRTGTGEAQHSAGSEGSETVHAGSSGAEQAKRLLQAVHDASTEYTAALMQVGARLQERLQAALEELMRGAPRAASQSAIDELNHAYRDILNAYQDQDWEKTKSMQTAYVSRLQAQYGDAEDAARNQLNGYANAVQAAWHDARSDALAAFKKHVSAVKDNFANLSVENVDPATIAMIAQSVAAVASYAHSAEQAAAAGAQPRA